MIELLLLLVLAAVLNWGVIDIYFYSIIFDRPRQYGEKWEESQGFWRYFRYMLACQFCFSHWSSAGILLAMSILGYVGASPVVLNPILAFLLIPAVARVSLVLRDYSLPPIVNNHVQTVLPIEEGTSPGDFRSEDSD